MANEDVFAQDWRNCLRAHYEYVVQNNDLTTERTLRGVMEEVGFTATDLDALYLQATMRAEDMPADFVPDMEALQTIVPAPAADEPEAKPADKPKKRGKGRGDDEAPDEPNAKQLSLF